MSERLKKSAIEKASDIERTSECMFYDMILADNSYEIKVISLCRDIRPISRTCYSFVRGWNEPRPLGDFSQIPSWRNSSAGTIGFGRVLPGIECFVGSLVWRPRRDLAVHEGGWFMTRTEPSKPDYERVPMSLPHSRGISARLNPSDSPIASLYKFKYNSYGEEEEERVKTNWFGFYHVRTRYATWSDNRAIIQMLSRA